VDMTVGKLRASKGDLSTLTQSLPPRFMSSQSENCSFLCRELPDKESGEALPEQVGKEQGFWSHLWGGNLTGW